MEAPAVQLQLRAASVKIAGLVGIKKLKIYHTENINGFFCKRARLVQAP
jgi:hypothetical protein